MKPVILSCGPDSCSTRRLKEAALQRGYDVKLLNTRKEVKTLNTGVTN